ncbi:MAG: hypothetical protein AAB610_03330 [Patescibacteria group bacterium]
MHKHDWIVKNKEEALAKDKSFWGHLSKEAYPITKGELRIPISIEPFILSKKENTELEADLAFLLSAAKKIAQAYYTDPRIEEVLAIDKDERGLILSAKEKDFTGIVRVDLFYSDTPRIVEINADYPDGFFMHDVTAHAMANLIPDLNIETKNHAKIFSDLLTVEGVTKDMYIFIGYDKERAFIDEFQLTKVKLEEQGWKNISIGTFEDLEFKGSSFYLNDMKIDAIRRGSELSKIRKIPGLIPRLLEAEKNGAIIINNFKMRLLGYKSLLAALWDDSFHSYLNKDEVSAIKKLLPPTFKLDDQKITREMLIKEKDTWVIKPIDLTEGSDVFVGQACSEKDWGSALDQVYSNPKKWIAQHKVVIPEAIFNMIGNGHSTISSQKRKFDCNPHIILYKDKVEMGVTLVRFSDSQVLNVAKGGGITYAFPAKD